MPESVRGKLNLGSQDYGVDLVLEDLHGLFFVVQCKYKNDENSRLNWSQDKIANLFATCPGADGFIVFSNAGNLDTHSKTRQTNFTFYSVSDLIELEPATLKNISQALKGLATEPFRHYEPKPHQHAAIENCVHRFESESIGQLILPCGAGKTLTALWIKEKLNAKRTLVLVPSLSLLRQIKNEWFKQRKIKYNYICVCSESDIDSDNTDSVVAHTFEVDKNVSTDPQKIRQFLQVQDEALIIFSTYHSLPTIAAAIADNDFVFDITFCDEAHKTAGIGVDQFSLVHNNLKVPSLKRLYMTATPRIVKESLYKKIGDDLSYVYDMNDPKVFGSEFYRMTFKDAIEQDILVDYQIIVIGVNHEDLVDGIRDRKFIDETTTLDELANNYALDNVMRNYNANHALTFHSKIKLAEKFKNRHAALFPEVTCYFVSGEQPTSIRNLILNNFKESKKAIVSNARCLTEGVDVPAIDLVYFCDPKNSKIDIVQAVGRALRKKEGKKTGYIVVPVFHEKSAEVEQSIDTSSFKNLLQVIRALCDQDERLQEEINSVAYGKGARNNTLLNFMPKPVGEIGNIIFGGFEEELKKQLFDQVINKTSNNWDVWFLELQDFLRIHNEYPTEIKNKELYRWVVLQRTTKNKNQLHPDKIKKLDAIDFFWESKAYNWEQQYEQLVKWKIENPAEKFPPTYDRKNKNSLESKLGIFIQQVRQAHKNYELDDYWLNKMNTLKISFDSRKDEWDKYYLRISELLLTTSEITPESIGKNEYQWVLRHKRKYDKNELSEYEACKIEELKLERFFESWDTKFELVEKWLLENRRFPTKTTNKTLYQWLMSQRLSYKNGNLDQIQQILEPPVI